MRTILILISIGFIVISCSYESITNNTTTINNNYYYGINKDSITKDSIDTIITFPPIVDDTING